MFSVPCRSPSTLLTVTTTSPAACCCLFLYQCHTGQRTDHKSPTYAAALLLRCQNSELGHATFCRGFCRQKVTLSEVSLKCVCVCVCACVGCPQHKQYPQAPTHMHTRTLLMAGIHTEAASDAVQGIESPAVCGGRQLYRERPGHNSIGVPHVSLKHLSFLIFFFIS